MGSILILEDDAERINRFRQSLDAANIDLDIHVWRSANEMSARLSKYVDGVRLISLDHDLYPEDGDTNDPGDGVQITSHLATMVPACPVIVHTSNVTRGDWMQGDLELGGWDVRRVGPIGSDWIEADWIAVVKELLRSESS